MPDEIAQVEGNVTADQVAGTTTESTQAQPTNQATAAPDWDALLESKLQQRLERERQELYAQLQSDLQRRDQSRDDQLLNRLQKRLGPKLDLYEQIAKEEGWEPSKLAEKKSAAVAAEFQEALKDTQAKPLVPPVQRPPIGGWEPSGIQATAMDLVSYIRGKGLDPATIPYGKYVGLDRNDPQGIDFLSLVDKAVTDKAEQAKVQAETKKQEAAQKVAAVKENFGGTATPSGTVGAGPNADSLEEEYAKLVGAKVVPLAERSAYRQRLNEIEQELKKQGRWT